MSGPPWPQRSRAVLIGAATYEHLDALPGVKANLEDLEAELQDPEVWGLDTRHCSVTCDPATSKQALAPLRAAVREARDTLLVYYAGHGLIDPDGGGLWLALPGSRPGEAESVLPYDWVRRALLPRRAERTVVILDCCYGGRALGMMSATESTSALADSAEVNGTYLIAAAGETVQAVAPPGERNTAFTGELLALLKKGVADGPAVIPLDDLTALLTRALRARSRPEPQARGRNSAGKLELFRNRAYAPPPDGTRLPGSRYQVTGPAGTTDGGAVNLAGRDTLFDRPVAIRVMRPEDASDPAKREAFVARLRARARLTHPSLALVLDWGEIRQSPSAAASAGSRVRCPYVVTEGFAGGTLAEWKQDPSYPYFVVRTALEVLEALQHAHGEGVSGWHLSPDRLHLTAGGHVKILDHHEEQSATSLTDDIAAVGELLHTLLGNSLHSAPPTVPGDLEAVVARARRHGYATAADMAHALERPSGRVVPVPGPRPAHRTHVPAAPAPRPPEPLPLQGLLRFAVGSHPGRNGHRNEDSAYAGPRLLAVADGRRGEAVAAEAGQVASAEVIAELTHELGQGLTRQSATTALVIAAKRADRNLAEMIARDAALDGLATTVTALYRSGHHVALLHAGDSTAFRLRDGRLTRLTPDPTEPPRPVRPGPADEAPEPPRRDRAVTPGRRTPPLCGTAHADPYTTSFHVRTGDRYLLCTSGLTDVLSPRRIEEVLAKPGSPEATVRLLVETALAGQGPDDITCVLADLVAPPDSDVTGTPPVIAGAVADTRRL
ncbi:caspase family protein [Streptomyces sp. NPDC101132]|uniref:caspase, EACC1-associated type n=1 Tax=Streptomyces sp. NPDC101132 TaxID=3366110 RepID=UPI0037FB3AC7